jgi:hypothetical protein
MKRALVVVIALGVLAFAGSALAKGPFTIGICGSSGCPSVKQEIEGRGPDVLGSTLLAALDGGRLKAPTVGAPAPAPFLSLRIAEWGESPTLYYVPSRRLLRMAPYWFRVPHSFARRLESVAPGLKPWPTPRLTQVLVDGRPAADPARYAVLLDPLPPAPVPTDAGSPVKLTLSAERANPWTDVPITYFSAVRTLYRDSQWLRIPGALATALDRDAGLGPPPANTSGSGPLPWIVAGGLSTLLLGAASGLTLRSRRKRPSAGRPARTL